MFALIDNPASGRRDHEALLARLKEHIAGQGDEARVFETREAGDGERQTRLALEAGCDRVAVIGGDGSLSDAVRALAGSGATLCLVPTGTGNDFARALGLPKDPMEAFAAQLRGEEAQIDCGAVNGRPFLNVAGTGFDVDVLRRTEELKAEYPGPQAYRRAILSVLRHYEAAQMDVSVDGGAFERCRATIVEIANGRYIGGGMKVAPGAKVDDGLFDVVRVGAVPRRAIPLLLPLFIAGAHVRLPVAQVCRARRVTIRRDGMTVNIDGDLARMDEARFEILPGALRVMRPAAKA